MRFLLPTALFLAILGLLAQPLHAGEPTKETAAKALAGLDGAWRLVSMVVSGKDKDAADLKDVVTLIRNGVLLVRKNDQNLAHAELTIDNTKDPKAIDLTVLDGAAKGKSFLGIYKLDAGFLTICHGQPDKDRPKVWISGPDSDITLMVFRRLSGLLDTNPKEDDAKEGDPKTTDLKPKLGKTTEPKTSEARGGWEFKVLSKEEIIELGKNDLTAGLNLLGKDGWMLGGVETGKLPSGTWFYLQRFHAAPSAPAAKANPKLLQLEEPKAMVLVVKLKHAEGPLLAKTLQDVLEGKDNLGVRVSVDQRTNSVLLRGAPAEVEMIQAVVERLDIPVEKATVKEKAKEKEKTKEKEPEEEETKKEKKAM